MYWPRAREPRVRRVTRSTQRDMFEFPAQGARPVWIASYPRSGNTFLRILLQSFFELPSYSLYHVEGDQHPDPSADALGAAPLLPRNWQACLQNAEQLPVVVIKTHGPPTDAAPAIFVARDGRAAIDSYFHYHKKFAFEQPSLLEVIAGACQFGSWSDHYWAWQPKLRPKTLLLDYDELVSRPQEVVGRVAQFLNLTPKAASLPQFQELQRRSPAFFRRGQNTDYLSEWTPLHMALFNQLHAGAMQDLGISLAPSSASPADAVRDLAQSAARLHQAYLEQLSGAGRTLQAHQAQVEELSAQIRVLTAKLEEVYKPLARSRWVRIGVALGAVPDAGLAEQVGTPASTNRQDFKPSGENTRSFLPNQPPEAPSVPSRGVSAPG